MKKFLQFVMAIKTTACLAFTAEVMLITVASMIFGRGSIPISYIWQMIFLALTFSKLQYFVFSENTLGDMKTTGRMAVLEGAMLAVLSAFAFAFQWFPADSVINWLIFVVVYAVIFHIAAFALRVVFRLGGMKYNEMLNAYNARSES